MNTFKNEVIPMQLFSYIGRGKVRSFIHGIVVGCERTAKDKSTQFIVHSIKRIEICF